MADRHRATPLSLRLPEAERQRLETYARERGLPVRRVIGEAVRLFLDQLASERPVVGGSERIKG